MKVSHFMTAYVPTCRDDSSLAEAEKIVLSIDRGPFPVVDREGRVVGILRGDDIRTATERLGRHPSHILVREAMSKNVPPCRATDDIGVALSRMSGNRLRRLPVVDAASKLVGAVCLVDPRLEENGGSSDDVLEGLGAVPEPSIISHRSPSYFLKGPNSVAVSKRRSRLW